MTDCKKRDVQAAMQARTFTGSSRDRIVCDIGARRDIKHFVEVQNLLAFDTLLTCSAEILDEPKLVYFDVNQSGVTKSSWTRSKLLRGYGEYRFPPVGIYSYLPGRGDQDIESGFTVDRLREAGTDDKFTLLITVSS